MLKIFNKSSAFVRVLSVLSLFTVHAVHAEDSSSSLTPGDKLTDTQLLVLRNLASDDAGEKLKLSALFDDKVASVRETVTPSGLNAINVGGIVYLYNNQTIHRYDLGTFTWLAEMPMAEPVTAFDVDENGIYVAHSRAIYRYFHDGSPRQFLRNSSSDIFELAAIADYIVYQDDTYYRSVDKRTGAEKDTASYFYDIRGISTLPNRGRLIGRSVGITPSDIVSLDISQDGMIVDQQESIYHGDYPDANRTFAFPDESRVIDNAGIVYHAPDLTYAGSLAGSLEHVAFYGDLPIVLRDGVLISYNNTLVETGQFTPALEPDTFFIQNEDIVSFRYATDSISVEHIDIKLLTPAEPGSPVDPDGLTYLPDKVEHNGNGIVFLLSRDNLGIFAYDVVAGEYVASIRLLEAPLFMTYSRVNDRLYVAYGSGKITQIDPSDPVETALFNSPQMPCGLATAGEFIFVCDPSGARVSHFVYSPEGQLLSQEDWNYFSHVYKWSSVNRKMYHFRDNMSPNDLLWEDIDVFGNIGGQLDSPFHGGLWFGPLCVNPNGENVIIGTGRIFDAISLNEIGSLSNNIKSCAWMNDTLFTFGDNDELSELQEWADSYERIDVETLSGTPLELFSMDDTQLILVRDVDGIPIITSLEPPLFKNGFE